jgi:hypothetical protein
MSRRLRTDLLLLLTGTLALTGCGKTDSPASAGIGAASTTASRGDPSTVATATPSDGSTQTSASALPAICTLLTKAEVTSLTGQQVTIMTDEGGNSPNARYCQWQLSAGQLTVTVDNESRESFDIRNKQSTPIDGFGETAYTLAGHLYVYDRGRTVDTYASSASTDSGNLTVEKKTAATVLPRLV